MKRIISIIMIVFLLAGMFTLSAFAEDYFVQTQADFEEVLKTAPSGSAIRLDHGEFKLNVDVSGKALTIRGAGADRTKLSVDAACASASVSFENLTSENLGGGTVVNPPAKSGNNQPLMRNTAPNAGDVASVNGVGYPSIQDAVDAANPGDTVIVTASHSIDASAGVTNSDGYYTLINVNKALTIDLNGCTVSADTSNMPGGTKDNMVLGVICVDAGGNLILKDSSGGSGTLSGVANGVTLYSMVCNYEGVIDIQSGNYYCDGLGNGRGMIYDNGHSGTAISGGSFTLANIGEGSNGSPWILSASGSNTAHVRVRGGTFNDDIFQQHWRFEVQSDAQSADTAKLAPALRDNGDGTYTVVPASAYVNEQEKSGDWYNYWMGYETLEDALAGVGNANPAVEEFVTVFGDITLNTNTTANHKIVFDGDVTLDLNGHDIHGEYEPSLFDLGTAKLTVAGDGEISHVSGNIFNGTPDKSQLAVSGGTWYGFDPTDYLVPGATAKEIDTNVWKVTPPAAPSVPATADNSNMPLWSVLFVLFAAVAVLSGKKRKA